jgi:hypothetical protein
MPICIAGMHRSGTSLTARLLNLSGLYIGPESDMLPAGPSNSDGVWENARFVEINDAILASRGGGWDLVPAFEENWELGPTLQPYRMRAGQILKDFEEREPWGWKDPRNTVTLPFWQRLIPHLKVLICVRHPLEVADSLSRRNGFSTQAGIALWAAYYSRLLAAVQPEQRLVTHFDSQFIDNQAEMRRILQFAGLPVSQAVLNELGAVPKEDLRHNRLEMRELLEGCLPWDVVRTYLDLCGEAGPVYRQAFAADLRHASEHTDEQQFEASNMRRHLYIVRLTSQLAEKDDEIAAAARLADEQASELGRRIEELEHRLQWKRHRLADWLAAKLHLLRGFNPIKLLSAARNDQRLDSILAAKGPAALPRLPANAPAVTRSTLPQSSSSPSSGVGLSSG